MFSVKNAVVFAKYAQKKNKISSLYFSLENNV